MKVKESLDISDLYELVFKFDERVDTSFKETTTELSGQTSMVKVTLELGQRRLGNRCGDVLLDTWAGLNVAYPLMGLRGTWLT